MLASNDIKWLAKAYSGLAPNADRTQVKGKLEFIGAYNKEKHKFTLVGSDDADTPEGVILSGSYNISIIKSENPDRLPKLYIHDENLPRIADRHFYAADKSACVCGAAEEAHFLAKGFNFMEYLEKLVIPFLYGQMYYDKHNEWPWREYAHNTTGILESYSLKGTAEFIPVILIKLRAMKNDWEKIRLILESKSLPRGHSSCFCTKRDQIRRCHPDAWEGIKKLYADLRANDIVIDE